MTISDVPCRAMRYHMVYSFGVQAPRSHRFPGLAIPLSTIVAPGSNLSAWLTNESKVAERRAGLVVGGRHAHDLVDRRDALKHLVEPGHA